MKTAKRFIMIQVLMNKYYQGAPIPFLSGISSEDAKGVSNQSVNSQEPFQVIVQPRDVVSKKIHYSWLIPALEQFSGKMQPLLISSLPKGMAFHLSGILKQPLYQAPSLPVRQYLNGILYDKLGITNVLQTAYLPQTQLSPLADLTKQQLTDVIDFLGIYDLAEEIRNIVDTTVIKAIYNHLSPKKLQFLRICLHQKEKLKPVPMGLKNWKGDVNQLERVLHRRGIMRLGNALSGQHPDFVWHIIHRLDIGRGNLLTKQYSKKEIPGVTPALTQQVIAVINYIKKNASTE